MSRFSGKQFKGAMRDLRMVKRAEAQERAGISVAHFCHVTTCPYVHTKHTHR